MGVNLPTRHDVGATAISIAQYTAGRSIDAVLNVSLDRSQALPIFLIFDLI